METKRNKHHIEFRATEERGEYVVRVFRDSRQLQIEVDGDDIYIDTDMRELLAIRDAINEAVGCKNREECSYFKQTDDQARYCTIHKSCFCTH